MEITGLRWLGTRTEKFSETVSFFREVMNLEVKETQESYTGFNFPNGDTVEVFGVAVPGVAVGLAAVPPQPLPDRAQLVDRKPGHPGVGIGHRHAPIPWRCRAP